MSSLQWLLLTACASAVLASAPRTATVKTTSGEVQGYVDGSGNDAVNMFLGIPFAAPPVGNLRFKPPQPAPSWSGVRSATSRGHICTQYPSVFGIHLGSEDCLYINVHTPANAAERAAAGNPLPVMVWIYGGAYILGDGYEFGLYDPRNLVKKQDVIIVTFNYRLHVFGFLAHPALANEDPNHSTGNYAMQDQRAALQWVQANIASFGGNPKQVTIFGESAGAFSVCYHLASPASKGLFQAAIMESGSCDTTDFFQSYELATTFGSLFTAAVGCNSTSMSEPQFLSCIRSKSTAELTLSISTWLEPNWPNGVTSSGEVSAPTRAEWSVADLPPAQSPFVANHPSALRRMLSVYSHQLKTTQEPAVRRATLARGVPTSSGFGVNPLVPNLAPAMPWGPAIDGTDVGLPWLPLEGLALNVDDVPLIIGTNMNEGSIFLLLIPLVVKGTSLPLNDVTIARAMSHFFNTSTVTELLTTVYPPNAYNNDDHRAGVILRDFVFVCPTRRAARTVANAGLNVWVYQYRYKEDWIEYPYIGDYHSSELPFVFDNQWPAIIHKFSANDTTMAGSFNTFWTNLAKYGNPNGAGGGESPWPLYNATAELNIAMDVPLGIEDELQEQQCNFWDTVEEMEPFNSAKLQSAFQQLMFQEQKRK